MDKNENIMKTGTTTVGILCKDGIVLAADKRATAGYLIASKKTEKIHKVTDNIAVTMAGTASDAQLLIRYAQSELRLKKIRTGKEATVKEAANLFSRLVYSNIRKMSMIPGVSHFVMGGKDEG
ncbi:proteasome subunit beta, partial [Candidatus Woesearchaeota archaeon]|nr:proteasome subunit beta [Candidatus Woesearchaeota archaeon]